MSAYTPKARDDFPLLADFARRPSGWDSALIDRRREAGRALDEIDELRREVHALKHGSRCPTDPEAALGYSVTPAESPAEAAVRPQERPEGSEATPTDELTRETFVWTLADNMRDATGWDACGEIAEQVAECFNDLGWRAVAVETEETPT